MKITLTRGKYAEIDEADYGLVKDNKWYFLPPYYAIWTKCEDGKKKTVMMHRVITKAKEGEVVDHKDRNGLNNRRNNLRIGSQKDNMRNSGPRKGTVSGMRGVAWHKQIKRWQATIFIDSKMRYLGVFKRKEDAAQAYNKAAIENFGEWAYINKL